MTRLLHRVGAAGVLSVALLLCVSPAQAGSPSTGAIQVAQQDEPGDGGDADGSALVVRLGRLEGQIRTLTGQIEQLQFQNKRLEDNLRKMQGDVDFRFQDLQRSGATATPARPAVPAKRSDADLPPADATPGDTLADAAPPPAPSAERGRPRTTAAGDAFNPDANPTAPGAPKLLGTTTPSQPLPPRTARTAAADPQAPLDLMQRRPAAAVADGADAVDTPAVIPAPATVPRDIGAVASLVPGGTREEYDADLGLYRQGQYDGAATGFQAFATKYPKDRLVPDAFYMAGESYARLGRHREAAEQFLKVSTDYGKSARAADALLRLGVSLNALGAKDQACATYLEVTRRYPAASADVRGGVDRELKRARCPGNG